MELDVVVQGYVYFFFVVEYFGHVSLPALNQTGSCMYWYTDCQSVLFSTSYTSGTEQIASEFNISETIVTLGLTFYLIGLAAGSVVMAPLSEIYGRRPVSVASLIIFNIMIIPCAVTNSIAVLIVFRFIGAFAGSVMISSAPGMVADLVPHKNRALAFSVWSLGPINGPGIYFLCFLLYPFVLY